MKKIEALVAVAAVALLGGCAAARQPADARGVAFPVRDASYLKEGLVVDPATVRLVQAGETKDQVRLQLGNPHFREGLFIVDQWNYILDLPSASGSGLITCQYQVQFDDAHKVKATYWQNDDCAAAAAAPTDVAAVQEAAKAAALAALASAKPAGGEVQTFSEDGLFAFGRSGLTDLDAQGRKDLEQLAERVSKQPVQNITVYGYADRIGSADGNYALSLARAHTVADLFVSKGIDPKLIEVVGKGRFEPTADCKSGQTKPELIDCLQPDRRVAVTVRAATAD